MIFWQWRMRGRRNGSVKSKYFRLHVAQKCHRSGGTQAFPRSRGTGCLGSFSELEETVQLPRVLIHDEVGSCRCAPSIVVNQTKTCKRSIDLETPQPRRKSQLTKP